MWKVGHFQAVCHARYVGKVRTEEGMDAFLGAIGQNDGKSWKVKVFDGRETEWRVDTGTDVECNTRRNCTNSLREKSYYQHTGPYEEQVSSCYP